MKEYIYSFKGGNYYPDTADSPAVFGEEERVRLIIEPCEYEIKLSGEILNKFSCKGYKAEISDKGAVNLYDYGNKLIASFDETGEKYREFRFEMKDGAFVISFGHTETVDNYPNCDGEYDRWSTRWIAEHKIKF